VWRCDYSLAKVEPSGQNFDISVQWKPATIDEVSDIFRENLEKCDVQRLAIFRQYSVEPYFASIPRFGRVEKVVVVAQKAGEIIYWEDVEEGLIFPSSDRTVALSLEHW
jgi:hypothetical protein